VQDIIVSRAYTECGICKLLVRWSCARYHRKQGADLVPTDGSRPVKLTHISIERRRMRKDRNWISSFLVLNILVELVITNRSRRTVKFDNLSLPHVYDQRPFRRSKVVVEPLSFKVANLIL
jgi:hypothetical protein